METLKIFDSIRLCFIFYSAIGCWIQFVEKWSKHRATYRRISSAGLLERKRKKEEIGNQFYFQTVWSKTRRMSSAFPRRASQHI
jgi:hypothetical protein